MKSRIYYVLLIVLAIMVFCGIGMIYAQSGSDIRGVLQEIAGSREGLGNGFSFAFDNNGIPGITYYDMGRKQIVFNTVIQGRWIPETIAPAGNLRDGLSSALVYDTSNRPHVAFAGSGGSLELAVKNGNEWKVETADGIRGVARFCSLIIDDNMRPHISYLGSQGLMLAVKFMGTWKLEMLDNTACGKTRILAMPSGGVVIYYIGQDDKKNRLLKTAYRGASETKWKISSVPNTAGVTDFDCQTGPKGAPAIAYIREGRIFVFRETLSGSGVWKEDRLEAEGCMDPSIAVSRNGFPAVTFISNKQKELNMARFTGSEWEIRKVASAKDSNLFVDCQLVKDKRDRDIVMLFDGISLTAFLQKGEGWRLGCVDSRAQSGNDVGMCLNENGVVMANFYDLAKKELVFVRNEGRKWLKTVVDNTGDVGGYSSLALMGDKTPAIAYYDATRGDLKFASFSGERWAWERIDTKGDVGRYVSMNIDNRDVPHVSYRDMTGNRLKYAFRNGHRWETETVSALGEYARRSVVLTDDKGDVKIVYTDGKKNPKAGEKESPVETSIRLAVRVAPNSWGIQELAGPCAVSITGDGLSAASDGKGDMAMTYINREGNLTVIRSIDGAYQMEKFPEVAWGNTAVSYGPDDSLGVLYIVGKTKESARLRFALNKKDKWRITDVATPDYQPEAVSQIALIRGLKFVMVDGIFRQLVYFDGN